MTRFARASGSKSSNLKAPEDSTPWEVMKEQLLKSKKDNEENKNREEAEKQRIENYNNFLKEQRTQKRKATWCDFPEIQNNQQSNLGNVQHRNVNEVKNKRKKSNNDQTTVSVSGNINIDNSSNDDHLQKKKKNKNKKIDKNKFGTVSASSQLDEGMCNEELKVAVQDSNVNFVKQNQNANHIEGDNIQTQHSQNNKKKKRNKKQKQLSEPKHDVAIATNNIVKEEKAANLAKPSHEKESKRTKRNKKQKQMSSTNENDKSSNTTGEKVIGNSNVTSLKKKKKRNRTGDTPDRRKPINDTSFHLIINSKEVQLIRFDGFPVMKKDAERLEELKKNMIKKGIPKSEVQRTMKLERRRAEKALARLKRDVCYNCRKGGHNLSDCPDLKSSIPGGTAEGVCFKCGSTEHRQFECKVQRDKEFRFATCFICKESGHIARQCPDNPKGLYPNGGCCKLCGDVTHLRKDCPTVMDKREGTSIKLHTLNSDNIEDIVQNVQPITEETSKKPKKIKF